MGKMKLVLLLLVSVIAVSSARELTRNQKRKIHDLFEKMREKKGFMKKELAHNETHHEATRAPKADRTKAQEKEDQFEQDVLRKLNAINDGIDYMRAAPLMSKTIGTLDNLDSVCHHVYWFVYTYLKPYEPESTTYPDYHESTTYPEPSTTPAESFETPAVEEASKSEESKSAEVEETSQEAHGGPKSSEKEAPTPAPVKVASKESEEKEEEPKAPKEEAPTPASVEVASQESEELEEEPKATKEEEAPTPASVEVASQESEELEVEAQAPEEPVKLLLNEEKRALIKRLLKVLSEQSRKKRSSRRTKRNAWWEVDWPLIEAVCYSYYDNHPDNQHY